MPPGIALVPKPDRPDQVRATSPYEGTRKVAAGCHRIALSPSPCSFAVALRLCCRGVNHAANCRDAICRKAALPGVLSNHFFIWRDIDAIDLVIGEVSFHPLDLRPEVSQDAARLL